MNSAISAASDERWRRLRFFVSRRSLVCGAVLGILTFLIYDAWFPPAIDQMVNDRLEAMVVSLSPSSGASGAG